MVKIDLKTIKKIHFIGLGGIGVSALARLFLSRGACVTGSDLSSGKVVQDLHKAGARVFAGHSQSNVPEDADVLVCSVAVDENNPEYKQAKEIGIPIFTYPQMLGLISRDFKTIAVAGTHGKTTTTAMVAKVMESSGLDPTVIVGSLLPGGSNYKAGKSRYLLIEADEYRRAFSHYNPFFLIITNIDFDHPDCFSDLSDVQQAFRELALRVPREGVIITDIQHQNIIPVVSGVKARVVDYRTQLNSVPELILPGEHNRLNAAAAMALASVLELDPQKVVEGLKSFVGVWRRFEYKGQTPTNALVYDDYAHNPQKIKAALQGVREKYPDKNLIAIFQPHTFSRLRTFLVDFADSLTDSDLVILLPVYGSREKREDFGFDSEIIEKELKTRGVKALHVKNQAEAEKAVTKNTKDDSIVIILSAGDASTLAEKLVRPANDGHNKPES